MGSDPQTDQVLLSPPAFADLESYRDLIAVDSPTHTEAWLRGAEALILSLSRLPHRFGVAREGSHRGYKLRQLLYHSHRILYSVDDKNHTVIIHRVLHTSLRRWPLP